MRARVPLVAKKQRSCHGNSEQVAAFDGQNVGNRGVGGVKAVGRKDITQQAKEFVLEPFNRYKGN